MAKRYTAVAVYNYNTNSLTTAVVPNSGEHWKELVKKHPEFKDDSLEWVSDDYDTAYMQFYANDLLVDVEHHDIVNPMTKKKKVENED